MPISAVRRATAYAIRPYRPTQESSSARAPKKLESVASSRSFISDCSACTTSVLARNTGLCSGIRVKAEFHAERVHVIRQRFDAAGEMLRIGLDIAFRVARDLPAIVDHDVLVARVPHAVLHHGGGDAAHRVLGNVAGELVPTVPAHRRRTGQAIVDSRQGCGEKGHVFRSWQYIKFHDH